MIKKELIIRKNLKLLKIGDRFTRWIIISLPFSKGTVKSHRPHYLCRCDCGTEREVAGDLLRGNGSKSCGCLRNEVASSFHSKHQLSKSREYNIWRNMISRCRNKKNLEFNNYGGRGIIVCDRWLKFDNFSKDMGKCPFNLQLDRIDNNGNYCKENCRWTTSKENNRNKRTNIFIEYNGETKCLSEWSEISMINNKTLSLKLKKEVFLLKKRFQRQESGQIIDYLHSEEKHKHLINGVKKQVLHYQRFGTDYIEDCA